jgi:uncharacterized cupin superfamily protein
LRHWHVQEDEFIFVLNGELTLVENDGEAILRAGDAAGFKANAPTAITWSTARCETRPILKLAHGRKAKLLITQM